MPEITEKEPVKLQNLYIVSVEMSSGHNQESSEDQGDYNREIVFVFPVDTRKKIAACRMRHKTPLYQNAIDFHGVRICREDQITEIMSAVNKASEELQVIDSRLGAGVEFFPLMTSEMLKGEQYNRIVNAIKYRVFKDVFERISEVAQNKSFQKNGVLTERTKESLKNLCEQLTALNILNDKEVDDQIANIQKKIEQNSIQPLIDEMKNAIEGIQVKSRWTAIRSTGEPTTGGA